MNHVQQGHAPMQPTPSPKVIYTKEPKFYIDATNQSGKVERHVARGSRVSEHGSFVVVIDHSGGIVLALPSRNVVGFGKGK